MATDIGAAVVEPHEDDAGATRGETEAPKRATGGNGVFELERAIELT